MIYERKTDDRADLANENQRLRLGIMADYAKAKARVLYLEDSLRKLRSTARFAGAREIERMVAEILEGGQ